MWRWDGRRERWDGDEVSGECMMYEGYHGDAGINHGIREEVCLSNMLE